MITEARKEAVDPKASVTRRKAVGLLSVGLVAAVLAACKSTSGAKEEKRNEGGY